MDEIMRNKKGFAIVYMYIFIAAVVIGLAVSVVILRLQLKNAELQRDMYKASYEEALRKQLESEGNKIKVEKTCAKAIGNYQDIITQCRNERKQCYELKVSGCKEWQITDDPNADSTLKKLQEVW